jgi:hypothetical protein
MSRQIKIIFIGQQYQKVDAQMHKKECNQEQSHKCHYKFLRQRRLKSFIAHGCLFSQKKYFKTNPVLAEMLIRNDLKGKNNFLFFL